MASTTSLDRKPTFVDGNPTAAVLNWGPLKGHQQRVFRYCWFCHKDRFPNGNWSEKGVTHLGNLKLNCDSPECMKKYIEFANNGTINCILNAIRFEKD